MPQFLNMADLFVDDEQFSHHVYVVGISLDEGLVVQVQESIEGDIPAAAQAEASAECESESDNGE
jgi:hypothetical protein